MTWRSPVRARFAAPLTVPLAAGLVLGLAAAPATAAARPAARPYDFNGDGRRDLATGSPGGKVGTASAAGFVGVAYGAKGGFGTKRTLSQAGSAVPGAPEKNDRFGASLASADFDRDGYADLAVGAPGENGGAGSVTVLWGSAKGLGRATAYGERGGAKGHRFGEALATGDIQGDGSPELFVTVPGTSTYTWLSFGGSAKAAQVPAARAASAKDVDRSWIASGDVDGDGRGDVAYAWYDHDDSEVGHRRGFTVFYGTADGGFTRGQTTYTTVHALAIGDFDGDRRADVVTGDTYDSPWVGGTVRVHRGGPFGLAGSYDLHLNSPGVPGTAKAGDGFGASLAVGDANGDGRADLAVGMPLGDVGRAYDAGWAFVLFGSASGLTGARAQAFSRATAGVPGSARATAGLGAGVALLDHDGDGRADLTAGTPGEQRDDGGVVYVRGGAKGMTASGAASLAAAAFGARGKGARLGALLGG
ncbi:FG-GAP-like repeat-containing protein [Actinomadura parmotrematis]|uniref:FG-GAP-like repeat-containing protein n=1 Tax=Actinomadura parmotrematis TaxID=2864039 RepID=A0ABS7FN16_9ACTN|nr:FG-GAP-like repeat-containing protein [Actinomadura parmotrematis]MBW8481761.1 FG-GAP-like repeat-containing protein [Actinomadura parmotrematis]